MGTGFFAWRAWRHRGRKRAEAPALEPWAVPACAARNAAIGALSASIAHEINQPLAAIQSYTQAAMRWLDRADPDLDEVGRCLRGLEAAVENAHLVVQRVRDLVGGAPLADMVALSLPALLRDIVVLAERDPVTAAVRVVLVEGTPAWVIGDPILLRHLVVNLITNAAQAMALHGSAERRIELALAEDRGCVRLTVRDTGPGFSIAAREAPLSAIGTTRLGGMGLGLSICRAIVERHGGTLDLANHAGGGALVTIELPCIEAADQQAG